MTSQEKQQVAQPVRMPRRVNPGKPYGATYPDASHPPIEVATPRALKQRRRGACNDYDTGTGTDTDTDTDTDTGAGPGTDAGTDAGADTDTDAVLRRGLGERDARIQRRVSDDRPCKQPPPIGASTEGRLAWPQLPSPSGHVCKPPRPWDPRVAFPQAPFFSPFLKQKSRSTNAPAFLV